MPSSIRMSQKLKHAPLCRCRFWVVCGVKDCYHYEPHPPHMDKCIFISPVKWCKRVKGFVHCSPLDEVDSNYECDPNIAFKAIQDANKRSKNAKSAYERYKLRVL